MHIDNANPQVLEMIINNTNSLNAGQSKNSIKKKHLKWYLDNIMKSNS